MATTSEALVSPSIQVVADAEESSVELMESSFQEARFKIIICNRAELGQEAAAAITLGNTIHKTAVLTGLGSMVVQVAGVVGGMPRKAIFTACVPLTFASVLCAGIYQISWDFDPLSKWQVVQDTAALMQVVPPPALKQLKAHAIVFERRDNAVRKVLHCVLASMASLILRLQC